MTAFANEIQQALTNTVGIMDMLLQWSRSQMQGISPKPTTISVAPLVEEVRQMADVIASPKQIAIDCGDIDQTSLVIQDIGLGMSASSWHWWGTPWRTHAVLAWGWK